jgi:hypothetical protein
MFITVYLSKLPHHTLIQSECPKVLSSRLTDQKNKGFVIMSTLKTSQVRESRVEEIQQRLGEHEDRFHSEHVRAWILQLAAEREAKATRSGKAVKSVKKNSKRELS